MKGELLLATYRITKRIEDYFPMLSKGQQKVACFIRDNLAYSSSHSASDIGKRAGTSETTVIRFCYAIGLAGFAQLQKEIGMLVFEQNSDSSLRYYVASKQSLFEEQQLAEIVMGQISRQIIYVAENIEPEQFNGFTKQLHEADTIYLIGSGASSFAVQWLQFTLNILRPNVQLVTTEASSLIRLMHQVTSRSVVLVVSLHRYASESISLAKSFQEQGAYVMAITDSSVAPIHEYADAAFVLQQMELSPIDLMPILISFMNTLVVGMMAHDATYYNSQRQKFDEFQNSFLADRWS